MRYQFGPFLFDRALGRLLGGEGDLRLRPKTFEVLGVLLDRAPELVSHDELLEGVWEGRMLSDAVLAQAISELRGALGDNARKPTYIETMHRRGYRFIHPFQPIEGNGPPKEVLDWQARSEPENDKRQKASRTDPDLAASAPDPSAPDPSAPDPSAPDPSAPDFSDPNPSGANPPGSDSPAWDPARRFGLVGIFFLAALVALFPVLRSGSRGGPEPKSSSNVEVVDLVRSRPLRVAFVPVRSGAPDPDRWPEVLLEMTRNTFIADPPSEGRDAEGRILMSYERVARLRHQRGELGPESDLGTAAELLGADHLVLGRVELATAGEAQASPARQSTVEIRLWRAQDGAELGAWRTTFLADEPASAMAAIRLLGDALAPALHWPRKRRRLTSSAELICWRSFIEAADASERQLFPAAVEALRAALALCPKSGHLRYRLAVALEEIGERREALSMARLAVETPGKGRWQRRLLERRLLGDIEGALVAGRQELNRDPWSAEARLAVAGLFLELGEPQTATQLLAHRSLASDPYFATEREALLSSIREAPGPSTTIE